MSNVLGVTNNAPLPIVGSGGEMQQVYTYDNLYRLSTASGTYRGIGGKTAEYSLCLSYDDMHRILTKRQEVNRTDIQFRGSLHAGYSLTYSYNAKDSRHFELSTVGDLNYLTEGTVSDSDKRRNSHSYGYDSNGNLVYATTSLFVEDGSEHDILNERKLRWDEDNRLLSVSDNGNVSHYWYDGNGERTVKQSFTSSHIYVNSAHLKGSTDTGNFTLYVSPYFVSN